ncbi:MAG: ATP-binding protein [Myxococcota bacterium]
MLRLLLFLGDALGQDNTVDEVLSRAEAVLLEHGYAGVLRLACDTQGVMSGARWALSPRVDAEEEMELTRLARGLELRPETHRDNVCVRSLLSGAASSGEGLAYMLPGLSAEQGRQHDRRFGVAGVVGMTVWAGAMPIAALATWSHWAVDNNDLFFVQQLSRMVSDHLDRVYRMLDEEQLLWELERSRQTVELLFEQIATPTLLIDPNDGQICGANTVASRYLGYSPEQLAASSFLDMKIGDGTDSGAQLIYRAQMEGSVKANGAFRRADGGVAFGRMTGLMLEAQQSMLVPEGYDHILMLSIRDTTERRAAQSAIQRAYDKLSRYVEELEQKNFEVARERKRVEDAGRLKSEFLANMSHELRTPMNAIIGFTQRVLKTGGERLSAREQRNLNIVLRNAETLLGMIDDLLTYSRLEAARMELRPEHFPAHELLEECAEIAQQLVADKPIEVHLECDRDITLDGDRDKLRQILLNLISNAAKFTPEGTITISGGRAVQKPGEPAMVELQVSDTGMGLRPEMLGVIFEAFRQVDGSHSRKEGGTGLGLAICAKLADLMGGRLTVDSTFGRGSTFTLYCPLEPPRRGSVTRISAVTDDRARDRTPPESE